jgi:5-methyltetrahydropteroyltriglutamate--homocysteine methyltransferase
MSLRTTVIGSFPKVTESGEDNLQGTIDRWQRQLVTPEGLEQEIQKVIRRAIREQEEAGLDVVSDGQIRWEDLAHPIARSAQGIHRGALRRFFDNNVYYRRLELNGVSWQKSVLAGEYQFAAGIAKRPVKMALPGPMTLVLSTEAKEGQTREKLLTLFTDLLKKEGQALEKAGVQEIQLDEPALDPKDPLLPEAVQAVNGIFQGLSARKWFSCYFQDVLPLLPTLASIQADVLMLDLVSPREKVADYLSKVRARLGEGLWKKEIALGLVDARNTRLEDPKELRNQAQEFAGVIPLQRLWLSPNSGLEFLPHQSAVKKLKLLCEAAQGI